MPFARGTRYAVLLGHAGSPTPPPSSPWDQEEGDPTPGFLNAFDATVAAGDVVRVQYDDNANFASPVDATDTLDAGEIAAGQTNLALSELASGTYYVRARVERTGVTRSPWSNVEEITIDA